MSPKVRTTDKRASRRFSVEPTVSALDGHARPTSIIGRIRRRSQPLSPLEPVPTSSHIVEHGPSHFAVNYQTTETPMSFPTDEAEIVDDTKSNLRQGPVEDQPQMESGPVADETGAHIAPPQSQGAGSSTEYHTVGDPSAFGGVDTFPSVNEHDTPPQPTFEGGQDSAHSVSDVVTTNNPLSHEERELQRLDGVARKQLNLLIRLSPYAIGYLAATGTRRAREDLAHHHRALLLKRVELLQRRLRRSDLSDIDKHKIDTYILRMRSDVHTQDIIAQCLRYQPDLPVVAEILTDAERLVGEAVFI